MILRGKVASASSCTGFAHIVTILIILAVLAGGGWYAWNKYQVTSIKESPSPSVSADLTAGWKTYRNAEYGFEFKYPEEWAIMVSAGVPDGLLVLVMGPPQAGDYIAKFYIDYGSNIDTAIQKHLQLNGDNKIVKREDITVNGINGTMVYFNPNGSNRWAFFLHNQKVYVFGIFYDSEPLGTAYKKHSNEFDQILSTFKFIPQ